MRHLAWILALTLIAVASTSANASEVLVTGSGTWDASPPVTPPPDIYYAAGESWSFSFLANTTLSQAGSTYSAVFSDFTFSLGGNVITPGFDDTVYAMPFYPSGQGGGFDLDTLNNTISLYTTALFDGSNNLLPGVYSAGIDSDGTGYPTGLGSGTVTIAAYSIPEPTSLISGGAGLLGVIGLVLRRRAAIAG